MNRKQALGVTFLGLGAVAAAAALWRKTIPPEATSENAEWLARIMLVEAADPLSDEGAAIGFVAYNRAKQALLNKSIREVVTAGNGAQWFGAAYSPGYQRLVSDWLIKTEKYLAVLALARGILSGSVQNPVEDRRHFFHPGSMRGCSVGCGKKLMCVTYPWLPREEKDRCAPLWAVAKSMGGKAQYEPLVIYPGVFAGVR